MKLSVEALNIILLLIPGLLSSQIFYSTFQVRNVSAQKRVLDAVLFTFVIYALVSTFVQWDPVAQVKANPEQIEYIFTTNNNLIFTTLAILILLPLLVGFIYYKDILHGILRKAGITTQTSRLNTWNDAFHTQDRYIIITMKDGRRVRGYPHMFSTDPEEGFIYLYNPAWVNDDKIEGESDYIESHCHGFLLNRDNIELIEFTLNPGETLS